MNMLPLLKNLLEFRAVPIGHNEINSWDRDLSEASLIKTFVLLSRIVVNRENIFLFATALTIRKYVLIFLILQGGTSVHKSETRCLYQVKSSLYGCRVMDTYRKRSDGRSSNVLFDINEIRLYDRYLISNWEKNSIKSTL